MTTIRRKFTPEEKARIVLEIPKEEKSVSQLASVIHTNVLNRWKSEAVQNLSQLFVDEGLVMPLDDVLLPCPGGKGGGTA